MVWEYRWRIDSTTQVLLNQITWPIFFRRIEKCKQIASSGRVNRSLWVPSSRYSVFDDLTQTSSDLVYIVQINSWNLPRSTLGTTSARPFQPLALSSVLLLGHLDLPKFYCPRDNLDKSPNPFALNLSLLTISPLTQHPRWLRVRPAANKFTEDAVVAVSCIEWPMSFFHICAFHFDRCESYRLSQWHFWRYRQYNKQCNDGFDWLFLSGWTNSSSLSGQATGYSVIALSTRSKRLSQDMPVWPLMPTSKRSTRRKASIFLPIHLLTSAPTLWLLELPRAWKMN